MKIALINENSQENLFRLLHLDLDVDAGRQIELHERVHGLVRRVNDVHQTLMGAD